MSYNLSIPNISDYFSKQETTISLDLPNNIGTSIANTYNISDEIIFCKSRTFLTNIFSLQSKQKINGLFISLLLDGNIEYKDNFLNKKYIVKKNTIKISYINEFDMTTNLNTSSGIGVYIKDGFFEKNFSKLLNIYSKDFQNLPSTTIKNQYSKNIYLAKSLYNSPFDGELQNIYLQSKVLELIYNECSEILNIDKKNKNVILNKDDIEALHKARDLILVENYFSDLLTLSKKVALNEFKLKYGFKQLFNTSPGQMILEQKMLYAKQLLETSEFSIAEISSFVGYTHQQNFTRAFIQFFKFPPKDIMMKRKYYF
ncbi:AraC family transcriptional regulator [Arcobacter lacus]|uniref:helix-turn-helix domain-containing protein n=1 Tax=Arcobacter lacus TaxID=1912876 RepID=UPI0021BB3F82|nr:AraC family transcriptional regulator [Arcobacter lacus]MCT7908550.1 AraC family transcriptional regulator [Arcobacter lacus]